MVCMCRLFPGFQKPYLFLQKSRPVNVSGRLSNDRFRGSENIFDSYLASPAGIEIGNFERVIISFV